MTSASETSLVCIVPRLGAGVAGGKMNAVFKRMNFLAQREDTNVVLLNLQHSVNQKVSFAQLQQRGILDERILHRSLYEFCVPPGFVGRDESDIPLPEWDQQIAKGGRKTRITYFDDDVPVMRDTVEETVAGPVTVRHILTDAERDIRHKYLGDNLIESLVRFGDGLVHKTLYAYGLAVCETRHENKAFRFADSAVTGRRHPTEIDLHKALAETAFPQESVVFVDGITSAYLSRHIPSSKVLFLHADHRGPDGKVVPRSRNLIESFDGDAIITATHVHKARLEHETKYKAPIRVIPHYTEGPHISGIEREHICTVSRLELTGKPVHQCIQAFTQIMHLIPDCNYLIYGTGLGQDRLAQLISHLDCEDRVFLMGYTTEPERVFASSLMSLAPTMTEGFGLALLESLTQGCPVISYDVDYGPRELVKSGYNGELVQPGDIHAIARRILKVHANLESYSAASTESATSYTFQTYCKNYAQLIDDMVGKQWFFNILSPDLKVETKGALEASPHKHKARLLDLYITLCTNGGDLAGTYWAFQQKHALLPQAERPLMRCIWLSRRLGRHTDCHEHLAELARRFPDSYRTFIERHPEFDGALSD